MNTNQLLEDIAGIVVGHTDSPYRRLMKKADDIDIDYFENIKRDENTLTPELTPKLKADIVKRFGELADQSLQAPELKAQIAAAIRTYDGDPAAAAASLRQYAHDRLLFIPSPTYEDKDVQELYERAKEVTLLERVTSSNKDDILEFYQALMSRTAWECKALIEQRVAQLLEQTADELEK